MMLSTISVLLSESSPNTRQPLFFAGHHSTEGDLEYREDTRQSTEMAGADWSSGPGKHRRGKKGGVAARDEKRVVETSKVSGTGQLERQKIQRGRETDRRERERNENLDELMEAGDKRILPKLWSPHPLLLRRVLRGVCRPLFYACCSTTTRVLHVALWRGETLPRVAKIPAVGVVIIYFEV